MQDFLSFVANLFVVDPQEISLQTAYQSIPQLNSMMQLRLVMEIEAAYDVEIPLEIIPDLLTLEQFYQLIVKGDN